MTSDTVRTPPASEIPTSEIPAVFSGWRSRFRSEHVGLLLTLSYLFLAAIGMFHEALVFLIFRINILDFAEPSDFLMAALRDPLIVIVSLCAVPLVWFYYRSYVRSGLRRPSTRWFMGSERYRGFLARNYTSMFLFTTLLYGVSFGMWYALHIAKQLRAGHGRRVHVELVADPGRMQSDTSPLLLLGSTQKYLFLYDPAKQVTSILPASNIARLTVDRRRTTQDSMVKR